MKSLASGLVILLVLAADATGATNASDAPEPTWPSARGHFSVRYQSELQPIVINRLHAWILHIEDANGEPVPGASLEVSGGMPLHDHGLPTRPRITAEIGDGNYRLDGMRFHMRGVWEVKIQISDGDLSDLVIVTIAL